MAKQKSKPDLEQRVLNFIREHHLIPSPQKLLVAVSGGADSVCLLHTLYRLQDELKIILHIAHLNHQLRGEESEADARYVADLARRMELPAVIEKRDVAVYQAEHGLSLEEAAREVRYDFLAQTARAVGAERVATGHTLNDQVETILLHIIRGAGTRGLCGLQPCQSLQFSSRSLTVIRPLLEVRRKETEECCSRLHLNPCLDTSNLSFSLLRNRVRGELLPLLQKYNPAIFESLIRISRIARDDLDFLEAAGAGAWQKIVSRQENTLIFLKKPFRELVPALQRHLLRRGIDLILGTLKDIEARHIEEIMDALDRPAGRRITLPSGLVFSIDYDRYLLGLNPSELIPFPEMEDIYEVRIPGETRIPGWTILASIFPREQVPADFASHMAGIKADHTQTVPDFAGTRGNGDTETREKKIPPDEFTACLDKEKAGNRILVRTRRRGDWFQPLGMDRPKKVGEFMVDARIPRGWRDRIPVFSSARQILWIAGWRIDERIKVTGDTREVLCLRMHRHSS